MTSSGPYVSAAFFCERVLEDKEGVLSAIRIVDRIITSAVGIGTPTDMPPVRVPLALLVVLKSGSARGRHEISLIAEAPSGLRTAIAPALTVQMEGEERGANLILNLEWIAEQEGLYWFDVAVGDEVLTRVPLRVVYQRQETAGPPGSAT